MYTDIYGRFGKHPDNNNNKVTICVLLLIQISSTDDVITSSKYDLSSLVTELGGKVLFSRGQFSM
jgi:hypothetical protein